MPRRDDPIPSVHVSDARSVQFVVLVQEFKPLTNCAAANALQLLHILAVFVASSKRKKHHAGVGDGTRQLLGHGRIVVQEANHVASVAKLPPRRKHQHLRARLDSANQRLRVSRTVTSNDDESSGT